MVLYWVIIVIAGIIVLWIIWAFNKLVRLRNRIENAWSQIDVQLKKRFDLVPNLVKAVKAYMKHERGTFKEITEARSIMTKAKKGDVKAKEKANNMLTDALKTIFAVAENYPKLRASENFMQLQEELSGIENKIAYARQFYNDQVLKLDNSTDVFPTSIIAKLFNIGKKDYFETSKEEKKSVEVKF
ncbi:MAG: LemA family protein [Promethearchaeota archaeon]